MKTQGRHAIGKGFMSTLPQAQLSHELTEFVFYFLQFFHVRTAYGYKITMSSASDYYPDSQKCFDEKYRVVDAHLLELCILYH